MKFIRNWFYEIRHAAWLAYPVFNQLSDADAWLAAKPKRS